MLFCLPYLLLVLPQALGEPGQIHVSSATYDMVGRRVAADWRCRGEIDVKGKGRMVRVGARRGREVSAACALRGLTQTRGQQGMPQTISLASGSNLHALPLPLLPQVTYWYKYSAVPSAACPADATASPQQRHAAPAAVAAAPAATASAGLAPPEGGSSSPTGSLLSAGSSFTEAAVFSSSP